MANGEPLQHESKKLVMAIAVVAGVVMLAIVFALFSSGGSLLRLLQDISIARGLITFLVAIVTVSIALIVAVWVIASMAGGEELKARFSYAKDVLATLVGILGTILGFYFGSAERTTAESLALGEIQFRSGQVIAYAAGGTAPYRYTLSGLSEEARTQQQVSKNGWIFESLPGTIKSGTLVTVEVVDSKDRSVIRTTKYQPEESNASVGQGQVRGGGQNPVASQPASSPATR